MRAGYLGIDVGTSALRATLLGEGGALVKTTSASYTTAPRRGAEREQEPEDWLRALLSALEQLPLHDVVPSAVGLCGQTPTLVLVDEDSQPVRPAMTWQDTRAASEAAELADRLGDPTPLVGTQLPWSAANMPAKLLWLARHEPSVVKLTRWLLQPKDYLGLALTGRAVSDAWSTKGICRVTDGRPATEVLEACGWGTRACPPTAPPWDVAGEVSSAASARFGLPAGTPVTVGWSDALAQVLAAGCYQRQSAFFFSGTSAIVGAPAAVDSLAAGGLFHVPESCSPLPLLYGPTQTSGAAISWVAALLGVDTDAVATMAIGATGGSPAFVPYLAGERAPLWDSDVRAVFLGVGTEHGPAHLARAVLEGVFLSARHVLSLVEGAGAGTIERIEVVGRGVGTPAWERIALASLGATLGFHDDPDLSARGAAMLGAIASGAELSSAAALLGAQCRTVHPSSDDCVGSRALLERYKAAADVAASWRTARFAVAASSTGSVR